MAKDAPSTVQAVANDEANIASPTGTDSTKVQNFLDRFASTPKEADEMRELLTTGAPASAFDKYLKGYDQDGVYARHFKNELSKVVG